MSGAARSAAQSLAELSAGETAIVETIDESAPAARRLLDLGLLPGTSVRVIRRAPLGDPTVYELRGSRLCLRREDARHVRVARDESSDARGDRS